MIEYSEDWLITTLFRLQGSVAPRACYFAIPTGLVALFLAYSDRLIPDFREKSGILEAQQSQLWQAATGVLFSLLIFRINRAMARFWEGTGLLHQMRGEWFDSVSCCVTFTRAGIKDREKDTMAFRHTIVRLMSLCHGTALKEIGGEDATDCETIDPQGLDNGTLHHLQTCSEHGFNRVEVLLHLIQSLITQSLDDGIIRVPAPIISRVYQTLSRGFVNLLNAKKIADTRFPFPFSQLISLLLFANIFLTPILVTSIFTQPALCVIFSVIPIFGMSCLNFIGVELENPFGQDDNDLPLDHFQGEMNNCLLMLLHSSADLLPDVDALRCMTDVDEIREIMMEERELDPSFPSKPSSPKSTGSTSLPPPKPRPPKRTLSSTLERGSSLDTIGNESPVEDSNLLAALPSSPTGCSEHSQGSQAIKEKPKRLSHILRADKLQNEEQVKQEAMMQGLERMILNLQSIKTAVEEQAKKVSESTQAMSEFCIHLDEMMHQQRPLRTEGRPSRRRNWECERLMRCM